MSDRLDDLATRISVADISTAVAYGLQRTLERKEIAGTIADKILRYGGRIHFEIEIGPRGATDVVQDIQRFGGEGGHGA